MQTAKSRAVFNWSGGKDSTLALHHILAQGDIEIVCLVTTVNEAYRRIAMHGIREELLDLQTESLGIPLVKIYLPEMPDMETYELAMAKQYQQFKKEGITHAVFGDIYLEDLRLYREKQMANFDMQCVFPIWQRNTKELIHEFIHLGYKTVVCCAKEELGEFCGKVIDQKLIEELPIYIDVCGENDEFHTFAFAGPIFKQSLPFSLGEKLLRAFPKPNKQAEQISFWYQDLLPV